MSAQINTNYISIYIQQDATSHSLFIFGNCSTCFGWYHHPTSGAQTTVSTASGICHTPLLLPATPTSGAHTSVSTASGM